LGREGEPMLIVCKDMDRRSTKEPTKKNRTGFRKEARKRSRGAQELKVREGHWGRGGVLIR